jgi:hypothetical protein
MLLSELFSSDCFFNKLEEFSQELLPQVTAVTTHPTAIELPQQNKRPHFEDENDDESSSSSSSILVVPPSKRVCTSSPRAFTRIPCRARGLSKDHTTDSAFFKVPVDAPHGLLLSCSHPECADSGRRFRYCTVCANPVAKRNFPKRHGHGLVHSAKDLREVDYMCGFIDSATADEEMSCDVSIGSSIGSSAVETQTEEEPTSDVPRRLRRVVSFDAIKYLRVIPARTSSEEVVQEQSDTTTPPAQPATSILIHNLSAHEKEWLQLLDDRPELEQGSLMAIWMDQIIRFSEEKGSALRRRSRARTTSTHQRCAADPVVSPQVSRNVATPPLPESLRLDNTFHETSSFPPSWTQARSVPPPSSNHMLHFSSDVSEFAAALDDIDMTTIFD